MLRTSVPNELPYPVRVDGHQVSRLVTNVLPFMQEKEKAKIQTNGYSLSIVPCTELLYAVHQLCHALDA